MCINSSPKGPLSHADTSDGKSPGFVFPGPLGCRDAADGKSPLGFEFSGPIGHHEDSDGKSPGFTFSMTSDPATPTFTGFSFDMGSTAQVEVREETTT